MVDLTLNSIMIPALTNYTPPFGTKVTRGIDPYRGVDNKGGLNILQVNNNIIAPFVKMRGVSISDNETTTVIEYDAKLYINANDSVTLSLGNGAYKGCKVTIINTTNIEHVLLHNKIINNELSSVTSTILPNSVFRISWEDTHWKNINAPIVGKIIEQFPHEKHPSIIYPCTEWTEVTKYDGAFFRASGGNADPFIEEGDELIPQQQETALGGLSFVSGTSLSEPQSSNPSFTISGRHEHSFPYSCIRGGGNQQPGYNLTPANIDSMLNVMEDVPSADLRNTSVNFTVSGDHKHIASLNGTVESDDLETRPVNFTIKLWKRIV